MTLTEERLRATLDGLAPAAPADLRALAGVGRAIVRHRRRRRAAVGGLVTAATAVVTAVAVAAGPAGPGPPREPADVATQSSTPAPPPTPPPAPTTVAFADVTFELPPGWEVHARDGDARLCVAPAGNPYPRWDDCAGLMLYHGDLPGAEMGRYEDHGHWSWYHHTDVNPCPTRPGPGPGEPLDGVLAGDGRPTRDPQAPIARGLRPVGDRTAVYDQWAAHCELSGFSFHPRAWHLPASQIVIFDVLGRPETEAILASFSFE